jgi:hypothetical protein
MPLGSLKKEKFKSKLELIDLDKGDIVTLTVDFGFAANFLYLKD